VHPVHLGAATLAQHRVIGAAGDLRAWRCPDRADWAGWRIWRRRFGHVRDYGMSFPDHAARAMGDMPD
jgi:hypothetical protein